MKLIKLNKEHYIIVDGFDIKEGDMFINEHNQISVCVKSLEEFLKNNTTNTIKKVTHSTKPLEDIIVHNKYNAKGWVNIKPLSLSEVEELLFGYSVEKLAESRWNEATANLKLDTLNKGMWCGGFQHGFNAHKELTKNKLFTLEDILTYTKWLQENASRNAAGGWVCFDNHFYSKTNREVFNKWYQPKNEWEVEFINDKLTLKQ